MFPDDRVAAVLQWLQTLVGRTLTIEPGPESVAIDATDGDPLLVLDVRYDDADEFAAIVVGLLDGVADAASELTTLPWPTAPDPGRVSERGAGGANIVSVFDWTPSGFRCGYQDSSGWVREFEYGPD